MRTPALVLSASILLLTTAALVTACSSSDGDVGTFSSPDAARDAASSTEPAADSGTGCPDGERPAYAEPGCVAFTDSLVTSSTTKLELKDLDSTDGGCGYSVDIVFDVTGQTVSSTRCAGSSDGGPTTTSLSLTSVQTAAMLADWTNIRRASVDGGTISCGWSLLEYPAAVTRTDSSGVTTIDTCAGAPSFIYDDATAFQSIVAFFAADGGS